MTQQVTQPQNMEDLFAVPGGWVWTSLGRITEDVEKIYPGANPDKEFTYLDIASIDNKQMRIFEPKRYLGKDAPSRARQLLRSGDVLFSTVRTYLKNIAIVNETYDGQIASTGFCLIRPVSPINSKLIFYWIQTDKFLNPLNEIQRGTSYPAVRDSDVFSQPVPLPPVAEQHRIVAKIEELFTDLDAGVEALNKVKAQLKRYRQAVLKHAFEGKLTAEWREAHKHELETASVLLERIKEQRKKEGKQAELLPVDTSSLPQLPEGWVWARIGEVTQSMKNGLYKPLQFYGADGTACLRMYNIENGCIVWKNIKRMHLTPEEVQEYELKPGDILVNRVNSRELVGKAASIPFGLEPCVYESKNIRVRLMQGHVESKYVSFWFRVFSQAYFNRHAQQTVGMASINQEQLGAMSLPLCSFAEQQRIVEEVELRMSIADEVEKAVGQSLKQADRLRQSILKRAFEGKLVQQDPSDEPADRLLEKIRAGRKNSSRSPQFRVQSRKQGGGR